MKQYVAALWLLLEKAFWQAVEQAVAVLAVSSQLDVTVAQGAAAAGIAAGLTIIANGIPQPTMRLSFAGDLVFRFVRATAASVLTAAAAISVWDWTLDFWWGALLMAVPPAATVVKGLFARRVGDSDSAATLSASVDAALVA